MKRLTSLLPLLFLLACQDSSSSKTGQIQPGSTPTTSSTSTTPSSTSPTPENAYTYLFPEFTKGGLLVGNTTNLLFALDLQQKIQTIKPPPGFNGEGTVSPKIINRFELAHFCSFNLDTEPGSLEITTGDKAWVDTLELTMSSIEPIPSDGSPPEKLIANQMCYGYRINDVWVWKRDSQKATWVAATGKYVMNFQVNDGPIDAFKVLFNNGFGSKRFLEKMVLVAKPAQ